MGTNVLELQEIALPLLPTRSITCRFKAAMMSGKSWTKASGDTLYIFTLIKHCLRIGDSHQKHRFDIRYSLATIYLKSTYIFMAKYLVSSTSFPKGRTEIVDFNHKVSDCQVNSISNVKTLPFSEEKCHLISIA